ncbi:MAG: recombinase family protein, partial [Clostridiaceae bacterium]|nr:recombinase family protein [Clostridiaceae bacterium]
VESFINAIFLYDDRMIITFNFKDGTKIITFADIEKSGLCSDFTACTAPSKRTTQSGGSFA